MLLLLLLYVAILHEPTAVEQKIYKEKLSLCYCFIRVDILRNCDLILICLYFRSL
jgi:hypothetical protein